MKNYKYLILVIILAVAVIIGLIIYFNYPKKVATNITSTIKETNIKEEDLTTDNTITFGDTVTTSSSNVEVNDKIVTIKKSGTYTLTGNGNYQLIVDISDDNDVCLILDNLNLTYDGVVINGKQGDIIIYLKNNNTLEDGTTQREEDAVIYTSDDLVITGDGSLTINAKYKDAIKSTDTLLIENGIFNINAQDDGIIGKDELKITNGTFNITAQGDGLKTTNEEELGNMIIKGGTFNLKTSSDGIDVINTLEIDGGTFDITSKEGIEAASVIINDGSITINASDDGINASSDKTIGSITINGGTIKINMGQGDTDAIDSNGNLYIHGGEINITAQSPFDYDKEGVFDGGTIYVNGTKITTLTNQMMGGGMMNNGNMRNNMNKENNGMRMRMQ